MSMRGRGPGGSQVKLQYESKICAVFHSFICQLDRFRLCSNHSHRLSSLFSFHMYTSFQMAERQQQVLKSIDSFQSSVKEANGKQSEKESTNKVENSSLRNKDDSSRDKTKTKNLSDHLTESAMTSLLYG